jgi:hypothetical protein
MRTEVEAEIRAEFREELLTIYDKRLILKKVATGDIQVEQKYKGKNCTQCSQHLGSTVKERLHAIKDDNKLAGHYPYKENGKWVIPAQQNTATGAGQNGIAAQAITNRFRPLSEELQETNKETSVIETKDNNFPEATSPLNHPVFSEGRQEELPCEECGQEKNATGTTTERSELIEANKKTLIIETKDNKIEEVRVDNQSLAISQKTHDTATVNSSGRIIPGNIHLQPSFHDRSKLTPMENGS